MGRIKECSTPDGINVFVTKLVYIKNSDYADRAQRLTASTYSSLEQRFKIDLAFVACSTPDGINVFVTTDTAAATVSRGSVCSTPDGINVFVT